MSNSNSELGEMFSGSARKSSGGAIIKVFESNRNRRIEEERRGTWNGKVKTTKKVKIYFDKI